MHDCRDIKRHSPRHKTNERFSFSFNPSHTGMKKTKHWLMNLSSPADARQFTASYREEGDPFWEIPINTTVNVLWCLPEGIINNNFLMFFRYWKGAITNSVTRERGVYCGWPIDTTEKNLFRQGDDTRPFYPLVLAPLWQQQDVPLGRGVGSFNWKLIQINCVP